VPHTSLEDAELLLHILSGPDHEEGAMMKKNKWVSYIDPRYALIVIGLIGLIGLIISNEYEWGGLIKDLSSAFIVAFILGFTIEQYLKREFCRDVFLASFRYVLRPELKEEVGRIIGYKTLCIKQEMIVTLVPIENNLLRIDVKLQRSIKNISKTRVL
jgi:hypothetical protein